MEDKNQKEEFEKKNNAIKKAIVLLTGKNDQEISGWVSTGDREVYSNGQINLKQPCVRESKFNSEAPTLSVEANVAHGNIKNAFLYSHITVDREQLIAIGRAIFKQLLAEEGVNLER